MKAHGGDHFAARFGAPEFKMRGVRCTPEGEYTRTPGDALPEVTVPDLFPTCSYCGSLTIDDFLKGLQTPGATYSGSDWKYGYPHKFYIEIPCEPYRSSYTSRSTREHMSVTWATREKRSHKFYTEHLEDATPEQMLEWQRVALPRLGVHFEFDDVGRLMWKAPRGYQASGKVP